MNICVFMLVVTVKRLDDRTRLLRGCGAIKINQRMPIGLLAQNREILANRLPIDGSGSNLVHTIICSTRWDAPLYSDIRRGRRFLACIEYPGPRGMPLRRLTTFSSLFLQPRPRCAPGRFRIPSGHSSSQSIDRIARNLPFP